MSRTGPSRGRLPRAIRPNDLIHQAGVVGASPVGRGGVMVARVSDSTHARGKKAAPIRAERFAASSFESTQRVLHLSAESG